MNENNNLISIVIPAFNEEKNIFACLESLAQQKTARSFEVVLVDNNSTDKTVAIAESFRGRLNLIIVIEKIQGRGAARARGFAEAGGKIILSMDSDSAVPSDWVEGLVGGLENNKASVVTGAIVVCDLVAWRANLFNWFWPKYNFLFRVFSGNYFLCACNFAVYKDVYERAGGFNPDLNAMEDLDLGFRINKFCKIVFLPEVVVDFSGRRFESGVFKGLFEYLIEFIKYCASGKKHGDLSDVR